MLSAEAPERIIADKAYDSDQLDARLAEQGIEMIAPKRANRSLTQDGRSLRRDKDDGPSSARLPGSRTIAGFASAGKSPPWLSKDSFISPARCCS